jgi:riboflavin kinase/FMN adenylyltransferase
MNYILKGVVVRGDGYGRKIGFPTVNLEVGSQELPKDGVYAGVATLENKTYKAGIVIGVENKMGKKVEAHLLDFSGDVYGKKMTLEIKTFLREYKKFETEEALILQIKEDLKRI